MMLKSRESQAGNLAIANTELYNWQGQRLLDFNNYFSRFSKYTETNTIVCSRSGEVTRSKCANDVCNNYFYIRLTN